MKILKNSPALVAVVTFSLLLSPLDVLARGGRGGGGGGGGRGGGGFGGGGFGGGGGYRGGGGYGGGYGGGARMSAAPRPAARPASPAMNRSPSMSRAAAPRPSTRPAAPAAGAGRGNIAAARQGQGARGTASGVGSNNAFNRPSQGQLNNFLNMPGGAARTSTLGGERPSQLPSGGNSRTFTTERGTEITLGGRGGSTTIGRTDVGAGVGGIKVETPGGSTYRKAGAAAGVSGPRGNSAVAGGSVAGYRGAGGASGAKVSGGVGTSSGFRAGGSASAVQGRNGYTAVNVRGGYGGAGVGRVGSATAVVGPRGNIVAAGRGAAFVNGQFVGGNLWRGVNGAFTHWGWYGGGWWGRYPGAWFPGKWALVSSAWATAAWALAGPYCGYGGGSGAYYDYGYGGNVAYDDGTVYQDGEPVASAEQYYDQANQIAATGDAPQNEEWLPLGIFAVIAEENQTQTDKVVQLAVNTEGVMRGNYHDLLADKVTPITGAVDKQTQRVALKIDGNNDLIVETGLYNLTNDEAPVLVHFGADRQEVRTFVRLKQPKEEGANEQ
ncbi:MAG TPA: hypothetical protein VFI31_30340 [Pirellulales bacterium]|nr:hypothetical protein [Pirellulales bacterium]